MLFVQLNFLLRLPSFLKRLAQQVYYCCGISGDVTVNFLYYLESGPTEDFVALSIMKPIRKCETATCAELVYNDDNIVEMDEVFNVYITNSPGLIQSIDIDRSRRAVTIIDDDSKFWVARSLLCINYLLSLSLSCYNWSSSDN